MPIFLYGSHAVGEDQSKLAEIIHVEEKNPKRKFT
jgi:hypothetical protein